MCSPKYQSLDDLLLPKMFKKKYSCFKVIEDRLSKLISKTCQPHKASRYYFKSTEISQEAIDFGFKPFDINSCLQPTARTKSEKRKNLKELIKWLCDQITAPPKPLTDDFDLLNGQKPSYYGLSCKNGKFLLEKVGGGLILYIF